MDKEEKRKALREKNHLYSVLMDNYDASRSVNEAVQKLSINSKTSNKINANISTVFKELLEGLETNNRELINLRKRFYSLGEISESSLIDKKVKRLSSCIEYVERASKEWSELELVVRKPRPKKKHIDRIKKGTRTPENDFRFPILEIIQEMGGSGKVKDILEKVYQRMKNDFLPADFEIIESVNEERWRNTAKWTRKRLKDEGLLKSSSQIGVWEISLDGKKYLISNR